VPQASSETARHELLRNKPFVALCAARFVSAAGDQVAAIALVLLIAKSHPATAVGGLLLAESLPMLLSTHASVIADRFERRRVMIVCQLGQALIFGAVTIWLPPYAALLALLVLASLLGTLLRSTTQVALQATVPDRNLFAANALLGVALWGSMILGPAIGGALAGLAGPRVALAVDTATFLVSAATLLLLPRLPRVTQDEGDSGSASAALRYAWRDPVLRSLMLALAMLVAFAGVDNVAMVFLVKDTLGASSGAYGAAMTAFGVGMVGGSLLVVRHPEWRPERILLGSFTATAVSTGALSVAPSMPVVYSAQIVGGAGNGLDVAAQTTLVQRRTPPAMLGRMAGAMNSAVAVGFVFAYLGGGALVEATSPRMAFAVATIGTVGALLVARPVWRAPVTAAT
jgi:MFS family permease